MLHNLLRIAHSEPEIVSPWLWSAAGWVWVFLNAAARLLGLMVTSPVFGHRVAPLWMRGGLAIAVAAVVTPLLAGGGSISLPTGGGVAAVQLGGEFAVGALLGVGVLCVFAGLKLAGELIDQQSGIAIGDLVDPLDHGPATASGNLLLMVGTLALLTAGPGTGHLLILGALLDSFAIVPPDAAWSGSGLPALLSHLGRASLTLGLQVAAPVLAAGAIVSWGLAAIGGATSGGPHSPLLLGLPLRVAISLGVLAMCLSGMTDAMLHAFDRLLREFPDLLSGA